LFVPALVLVAPVRPLSFTVPSPPAPRRLEDQRYAHFKKV